MVDIIKSISIGLASGFGLWCLFSILGYSIYKFYRWIDDN